MVPVGLFFVLLVRGRRHLFGRLHADRGRIVRRRRDRLMAIRWVAAVWPTSWTSLLDTAISTGMIFVILIGADLFNGFLALSGLPQEMAQAITASGLPPMAVIVLILLVYLVLGCLMDSLSMILLTIPIFFPVGDGARSRPVGGARGHLVRHHRSDRRRGRPHHAAGRASMSSSSTSSRTTCRWPRPSRGWCRSSLPASSVWPFC